MKEEVGKRKKIIVIALLLVIVSIGARKIYMNVQGPKKLVTELNKKEATESKTKREKELEKDKKDRKELEDVATAYMQAVNSVSTDKIKKYSPNSQIIETLSGLYATDEPATTLQFKAETYKQVLKTLEIKEVTWHSKDEDEASLSFEIRHIDLNFDKFWEKDKDKIFEDLKEVTTHSQIRTYLYDYVDAYYKDDPAYEIDEVEIQLQKSAENNWIVINDEQIDALGKYPNNVADNGPVGVIHQEFLTWYQPIIDADAAKKRALEESEWQRIRKNEAGDKVTDDPHYNYMPGDSGEEVYNPFDHKGNADK